MLMSDNNGVLLLRPFSVLLHRYGNEFMCMRCLQKCLFVLVKGCCNNKRFECVRKIYLRSGVSTDELRLSACVANKMGIFVKYLFAFNCSTDFLLFAEN